MVLLLLVVVVLMVLLLVLVLKASEAVNTAGRFSIHGLMLDADAAMHVVRGRLRIVVVVRMSIAKLLLLMLLWLMTGEIVAVHQWGGAESLALATGWTSAVQIGMGGPTAELVQNTPQPTHTRIERRRRVQFTQT